MDNLDPAQFDLLVRVLSRSSLKRDFNFLLPRMNIKEVIDNLEEFLPQKVPRLNFMGSGDARAREWV